MHATCCDVSKVALSKHLYKKLSYVYHSNEHLYSGYVIGYQDNEKLTCIDCTSSTKYILEGLDVVGIFCCLKSGTESGEEELTNAFQSKLSFAFQASYQNKVVLLVRNFNNVEGSNKLHIVAKIFLHNNIHLEVVDNLITNIDCPAGMLLRAKGYIPLYFEFSAHKDLLQANLEAAFEKLKNTFISDTPALFLRNSEMLLTNSSNSSMSCRQLLEMEKDDDFLDRKTSKLKKQGKVALTFDILLQATGDAAIENSVSHSLVIHCQRRDFCSAALKLPLDVIVFVLEMEKVSTLYKLFVNAILNQLFEMMNCLLLFHEDAQLFVPTPYHFYHDSWDLPISVIYPSTKSDEELETFRKNIHSLLLLPMDRPLLRKKNQYLCDKESPLKYYLKNTHVGLPVSVVPGGEAAIVNGTYTYHHYMQDHMNDDGWGCAYRSLQTIFSWFRFQGYTDKNIPTHKEIQQTLVDLGDKPQSFVNSKQWIGSQEVSFCLHELLGITSKIMFVSSGAELGNKGRDLLHHFRYQGTPIMIGGGVLAHTIIGVDFNEQTGDLKFLILDPHYTGSEDLQIIQNKGWCGWKGMNFWDKTAFYNLCLPQCPPAF